MRSQFASAGAAAAILSAAVPLASAQLYSSCNPTENCMLKALVPVIKRDSQKADPADAIEPSLATCPPDVGLDQWEFTSDFTTGNNDSWIGADYTVINYGDNGAEFTINKDTDAPTMHTEFYTFFGYYEVEMKAAPGTGVVSSIVLESDDLDEVDWEFLGGNNTSVQSNYFGKGNTTSYDRGAYHEVDTPVDTWHKYAFRWTNASMEWIIDGTTVRTLEYADALGGKNYPQTPARLSLGVWSAGTKKQNYWTVQWAGGYTDFDEAPFTMYVRNVKIINYNPAKLYNWTDTTGSFESISLSNETVTVNSTATTDGGVNASDEDHSGVVNNGSTSTSSSSGGSTTASSASSSGTAFAQNGSSGASPLMNNAWIFSTTVSLVSFAIGFSLL
ncbi:Glycoside hydrolase family 16 [Macrophomina phaseolina MS6]|uniref:chitinase n=2 Tax=Macrophomina phaseolina TaxID=35725 RepID=K2RQV6_MACPH|nr:Glycoside hydrolase family 16 [Macrophomina phaseolina MS6]KAH7049175.1 concanavalin A-like lectin/glucanase domain-containing protein [Macrophomina phaseolina]